MSELPYSEESLPEVTRSLRRIARRLDRPLATVKTWNRRGIERLRAALDRRTRGDRSAWSLALAPLLQREPPRVPAARTLPLRSALWTGGALASLAPTVVVLRRAAAPAGADPLPPVVASVDGAPRELVARPDGAPTTEARAPATIASAPATQAPAPRVISVRVVDAEGRPHAGARVLALDRERRELVETQTDLEGRARLSVDPREAFIEPAMLGPAPRVIVNAHAAGHASSYDSFADVALDERPEVLVTLRGPGFDLHGVVLDEEGAPIVGAVVQGDLVDREMVGRGPDFVMPLRSEAMSDAQGRFELDGIHLEHPAFRVVREGFVPRRLAVAPSAGGDLVEHEIRMSRGARLSGVLRDHAGAPAAGARVTLPCIGMFWAESSTAVADEHGRYALLGVPDMTSFVVAVDARDETRWASTLVTPTGARELEWNANLRDRDPIAVQLLDEQGRPAGQRIVRLASRDPSLPWVQDSKTDAAGRALFRNFPDAPLELAVYGRTYLTDGHMDLIVPDIAPAPEVQVLRFGGAVDRETATLRASVPAGAGRARLLAYHLETKSQRDVEFERRERRVRIGGLAPGEYELFAIFEERGLLALGGLELGAADELDLGLLEPPPGEVVTLSAFPAEWTGERSVELLASYDVRGATLARSVRRVDLAARLAADRAQGSPR